MLTKSIKSRSWEFKTKTPRGNLWLSGQGAPHVRPAIFCDPQNPQTQQEREKGPSRFDASSAVSRGNPSGLCPEPRAKAEDRKRATTQADVLQKALGMCFGVSNIRTSGV